MCRVTAVTLRRTLQTSLLLLSMRSRHAKTVPSYYGHVTIHMQLSK
jgi:hypothetical protein